MKSSRAVVIGGVLTILAFAARSQTAWQQYVTLPSPENAAKVQVIAHDPPLPEKQMLKNSDGALTEQLLAMLSRLVRPSPRLYLQALSRNVLAGRIVYGSVASLDEAFVDREEARRYEYQARIRALLSVKDRALRKERRACTGILERLLKRGA